MSFLDNIFIVFMFVLPYAICMAAYIWVAKKALKVPNPFSKIAALIIIAAGFGYTIYRLATSISHIFTEENFQYIIMLIMVGVLAIASIIMAFGQPDEEEKTA